MTTTSKPKPGRTLIRSTLIVIALLVVAFGTRGYLMNTSPPDSALATSGSFDTAAMVVTVLAVAVAVAVAKLLRRGK